MIDRRTFLASLFGITALGGIGAIAPPEDQGEAFGPEQKGRLPRVSVIGLGGGGSGICRALQPRLSTFPGDIRFTVINTDQEALERADRQGAMKTLLIGTRSEGAGFHRADPRHGQMAVRENREKLSREVEGTDIALLVAGLGGGMGTGAAPEVAEICRAAGALTIAVVTMPFSFEGERRGTIARQGIARLRGAADAVIELSLDDMLDLQQRQIRASECFLQADDVVAQVTADLVYALAGEKAFSLDRNSLAGVGRLHAGFGEVRGHEGSGREAMGQAVSCPFLPHGALRRASKVFVTIAGGEDLLLQDVTESIHELKKQLPEDSTIIFSVNKRPELADIFRVMILAAGTKNAALPDNVVPFRRRT